ncbi:DUF433 domain-containing protein [Rubrivirga sp.]|uniref:DUF433 domain-containing protein n=1 Tax=Rubrivirga sp. TaxID=1885344 RepID=UPI003B519047
MTVLDRHIDVTPGICGGRPRIAGHRITVQNVADWHERQGLSVDEIATAYGLSLGDVHAALAYYYDHRSDVDARAEADAAFAESLRSGSRA